MAWTLKYCNLGATNNGDGTAGNDAASGGAAGGWNSLPNAITGLGTPASRTIVRTKLSAAYTPNAAITLSVPSSVTIPVWWQGYVTTPGDIDADNTLTKVLVTNNNTITVSTAYQQFSGFNFTSSSTAGAVLSCTAGNAWFHRCRVAASGANSASSAIGVTTAGPLTVTGCDLTANALASVISSTVAVNAVGNNIRAGLIAILSSGLLTAYRNVIDACSGSGLSCATCMAAGNMIYSIGSKATVNGILLSSNAGSLILNNIISNFNGTSNNAISGAAGAGMQARIIGNGYFNCTNVITNVIEAFEFNSNGTLASDPFVNAAGHDFTTTSVAKALGFPGAIENSSMVNYLDLGALQHADPASTNFGGQF